MNEIKAIETTYRGYRFRSRLEARWAMFFDAAGVQWEYEVEPISVNGEAYLPDFILNIDDNRIIHEVKAAYEKDRIRPMRVYLAGKMQGYDWRHRHPSKRVDVGSWLSKRHTHWLGSSFFEDVGPFPANFGHYGGIHLAGDEEDEPRARVLSACEASIRSADIFCAHISTMDAYGTLVEIGFARALGKLICITAEKSVAPVHEDAALVDHGWAGCDLWFPCIAATEYKTVIDDEEARDVHGTFIARHTAKEYRKISGIGRSGASVVLTCGDPADFSAIYWRDGKKLVSVAQDRQDAALAARAYRFDRR